LLSCTKERTPYSGTVSSKWMRTRQFALVHRPNGAKLLRCGSLIF
jgi:hypothetical protein